MATEEMKRYVFRRDNYTCVFCRHRGNWATLVIDHSIPLSRSGTDHLNNLQTACRGCNWQKGDMTTREYRQWRAANRRLANHGP